jgi:hypothetical protein
VFPIFWPYLAAKKEPRDKAEEAKIVAEVNRVREIAESSASTELRQPLSGEETMFMQILHSPLRRKGKWWRYPEDM